MAATAATAMAATMAATATAAPGMGMATIRAAATIRHRSTSRTMDAVTMAIAMSIVIMVITTSDTAESAIADLRGSIACTGKPHASNPLSKQTARPHGSAVFHCRPTIATFEHLANKNEASFPFDRARWLRRHIVDNAVDAAHFIDDAT